MDLKSLAGLGRREAVEVRSERRRRGQLRRHHARISGARRSRTSWSPTGLSIGQVEQQLANNNINAGGSFVEAGLAADQCPRGRPDHECERYRADRPQDTERNCRCGSRISRRSTQGPKIRLGQIGKAIHRDDGKVVDNDDVVEGIVLLRKGADADATLEGHSRQGEAAQRAHPAARREDRAISRPQRSGSLHHAHGAAQPDRRHDPGVDHPVSFSWAMRAARSSSPSPFRSRCCSLRSAWI